jgi:hypothetical protein
MKAAMRGLMICTLLGLAVVGEGSGALAAAQAGSIEIMPSSGAALGRPDVTQMGAGLRVRGSICRKAQIPPAWVRIERIDAGGTVVAAKSQRLSGLSGKGRRCSFYELTTDWSLGSGERVRLCATRTASHCRPPATPGAAVDH